MKKLIEENLKEGNFFFIVGSQRSGTTLLRLSLNSHPDLIVYDEYDAYERLALRKFPQRRLLGFKIPIWTHRYHFLMERYPNSKFIFLKRDIKGVAASMLSLKFEEIDWTRKCRIDRVGEPFFRVFNIILGGLFQKQLDISKRVARLVSSFELLRGLVTIDEISWIEKFGIFDIESSIYAVSNESIRELFQEQFEKFRKNEDWVSLAVLCAYEKMYLVHEYEKRNLNVLQVEYERLVRNPEETMKKILGFLGVKWHMNVFHHHRFHKGTVVGKTDSSRKIDRTSLDKWKSCFSEKDIVKIDDLNAFLDEQIEKIKCESN